jgi:2-amino-4-hydroxy-6-hydroxymethyldihydropteridine diphosphokinase
VPTVLLALGSNLGQRMDHLRAAWQALAARVSIGATSPIYETGPLYVTEQPAFLNMVLRGNIDLSPEEMLAFIKKAEHDLGRAASVRFGPRVIDIDIIDYDGRQLQRPDLVIPHPRLHERAFVLRPLADVAPHWVHPRSGKTALQLLCALPDKQEIRPYSEATVTP